MSGDAENDALEATSPTVTVDASGASATRGGPTTMDRGYRIGRYVVVAPLGAGGFGVVYKAWDPELDRAVALKVMRVRRAADGGDDDPDPQARLLREARALAQLSHPNVIAVHDVGTVDDNVFVAMELVEGTDAKRWLRDTAPPQREILRVFIAAGRGLEAAHSAGIVHRDFKPANVIVGDDGRVRVLDFGLARGAGRDEPRRPDTPLPESSDKLSAQLTQHGFVVGTPAYMAPEQHRGKSVDERSDQFSFCVALFQGLYGVRPFAGDTHDEVARNCTAGRIADTPANARVPARLRRIVLRGLSVAPEDRYPSMTELLEELEHDPAVTRRRAITMAVVGLLAALAVFGLVRDDDAARVCSGAEAALGDAWDAEARREVGAALRGAELGGGALADQTAARVEALLDGYAADWRAMHREACEDTRVRRTQSERILDLRMQCLDRRRTTLRALTELLRRGDRKAVTGAVQAALELDSVTSCAEVDALATAAEPPADPRARDRVAALRERLSYAEAQYLTGYYQEGLETAEAAVREAREVGYKPALAEALFRAAQLYRALGDYPSAETAFREGGIVAADGRVDELVARCWSGLIEVLGFDMVRFDEALALRAPAEAAIARAGHPTRLRAELLNHLGRVLYTRGDYDEARAAQERALELHERAPRVNLAEIGDILGDLGMIVAAQGNWPEAAIFHTRSLAARREALGDGHPRVADSLNNLGVAAYHTGELDKALDYYQQALEIKIDALGEDHPSVAATHNNLGTIYLALGQLERARDHAERALAAWSASLGPDHPDVAIALTNLGDLELQLGNPARARELCERALALDRARGESHPDLAYALTCVGEARLAQGDAAGALPILQRALELRLTNDTDREELGRSRFAVARALRATGGSPRDATDLATAALADYEDTGVRGARQRRAIRSWLGLD